MSLERWFCYIAVHESTWISVKLPIGSHPTTTVTIVNGDPPPPPPPHPHPHPHPHPTPWNTLIMHCVSSILEDEKESKQPTQSYGVKPVSKSNGHNDSDHEPKPHHQLENKQNHSNASRLPSPCITDTKNNATNNSTMPMTVPMTPL